MYWKSYRDEGKRKNKEGKREVPKQLPELENHLWWWVKNKGVLVI